MFDCGHVVLCVAKGSTVSVSTEFATATQGGVGLNVAGIAVESGDVCLSLFYNDEVTLRWDILVELESLS